MGKPPSTRPGNLPGLPLVIGGMNRLRIALLCVFTAACGSGVAPAAVPRPAGAALGRIVCDDGGARVLTPRIRAKVDGVHILFRNRSGAIEFYMRGASSGDNNHGGRLRGPTTRDVSSHAPGTMWVACRQRGEAHLPFYEHDPRYDSFEIVDPDGLWVPHEPDCSDPEEVERERIEDAETIEDVEAWVRDRFGVHDGERRRPGYPQTQWKGDPWVIVVDGRTLVYFHAVRDDVGWMVLQAQGCSQS